MQSWLPEQRSLPYAQSLLLLGHVKLLQQHSQGSAKESFTAGKASVSQFAGDALTVTGEKRRKANLCEKAANKKQRQMCPGGDLVWSHCADGI